MLTRLSWMTAILLLGSGCSMLESGARTLFTEPCEYASCVDDCTARLNHQIRASHVWAEIQLGTPDQPFSEDYANGFKEGYADYLYAGGTGQPPPLPPRKYWATRYATWEGRQAVQDWFAGFRHGAMLAQETGYRQYATVPSSLPASGAACSYCQPASPAAAPDHPPLPEPAADPPPPEIVPAPTEPANAPAGMESQPAGDGPNPLAPADVPSPPASTYELEAARAWREPSYPPTYRAFLEATRRRTAEAKPRPLAPIRLPTIDEPQRIPPPLSESSPLAPIRLPTVDEPTN